MATPESFEVCFLGDRSESMVSMEDAPWQGVRDWGNTQVSEARENNYDTRVTVVVFNDEPTRVLDSVPVSAWTNITNAQAREWMAPAGCTRLYDTVIEELDILRKKTRERGDKCKGIFALFTDGVDNVSYGTLSQMNKAVKKAREEGIVCYFLAANQDAIATGHRYGFDRNRCMTTGTDPVTATQAYKSLSAAFCRTTTTPHLDKGFTQIERHSSAPTV